MRHASVALGLLLLLGLAAPGPVRADEVRLLDGEILHGQVTREDGLLEVAPFDGGPARRLDADAVAEVLPGPPPRAGLLAAERALAPDDVEGIVALAWRAWAARLDEEAVRLARAAVALRPDEPDARRLLGHVRVGDAWVRGWRLREGARDRPPRWGRARERALARQGGDRRTREAADAALAWLVAHVDEDGRLDADGFERHCPPDDPCGGRGGGHHGERVPCPFDDVTTASVVLALTAGGSTPVSGPHARTVAAGLAPCRARLEEAEAALARFDGIWNVAHALEAAADVCWVRRDADLRRLIDAAAAALLRRQRSDGGFSYVHPVGDVPTTAVVLEALAAAARAGTPLPPDAVGEAIAFLEVHLDRDSGRTTYHAHAAQVGYTPTTANTAGALAARALLGATADIPERGRQVAALTRRRPRWSAATEEVELPDGRTVEAQVGTLHPWAWYQTTLALERLGGAPWRRWGGSVRAALRDGQRQDGHAAGSWDPEGPYALAGGRAHVTAMAALMLQAACRYPPAP